MRKLVYIAGPISKGDLQDNLQRGSDAFKVLAQAGMSAICPHWSSFSGKVHKVGDVVYAYASADGNGMSHQEWIDVDLEFVRRSDAVLRLSGLSTGADMEVAEAKKHGIPVFDSIDKLIVWSRDESFIRSHGCFQPS